MTMNEPAQVQEKAPKPQGLLPKNVQSWLLISLAMLMILIMWLTGDKKPQTPTKATSTVPVEAPVEVNETKIAELQNRIQELQRQQLVAQSALAQQTRLLGVPAQDPPPSQQGGAGALSEQRTQDPIEAERNKRAYMSLFASNVALTYRKPPASAQASVGEAGFTVPNPSGPETEIAQLVKDMRKNPIPAMSGAPSSPPARKDSAEATLNGKQEAGTPAAVSAGAANQAAGRNYVVFEGTILESILINRLDGQFAGPIECLLSTDVYSRDRQHLLIPAGSRLLGETKKVDTFGQNRLAVTFHRLLMPNGYSVSLDQFKGLNQIGDTGLRDEVNNHYLHIFGVSLAIGAIGAASQAGTGSALTASGSDLMRQGFAQSTAQSSAQIGNHDDSYGLRRCEQEAHDNVNGGSEKIAPSGGVHTRLEVRHLRDDRLQLGLVDPARQELGLVCNEVMKAGPDAGYRGAVVTDHRKTEADGQQQARKVIEFERMPAARGRKSRFDSVPSHKDRRERPEEILAHSVEEAEVLGEQGVDRLKDILEEIGLHGRQLPRRWASFAAHSRHAEVLKRIAERAGHLRQVGRKASLALNVGVDGVGGGLALLLGEDGLLFEKRGEELV
jgi:type IV secretion system protein TrbI